MKKLLTATATPLASIFGSGFLVIVPILKGAVGPYALFAMAGVCALAFAVGGVIRFNIRHAEPLIEDGTASDTTRRRERTSDLMLVVAYAISVCLYINILSSFLLSGLGVDSPLKEHIVTCIIILMIGAVGFLRGLDMLQHLEKITLGVTLLIIVALLVSFGSHDLDIIEGTGIQWPEMPSHSWWEILTLLGGTLIVVQGFETSRYLGKEFDAETRIRSCRLSQIIATVVYLIFVALALPLMHFLGDTVEPDGLIMLAGKVSVLLPIPLVCAAVLSQFSAAVADTIGGGGNTVEATNGHIDDRHAYVLICGMAAVLAFSGTLTILAIASRAFALYYTLQCLVAISVSKSRLQRIYFGLIGAVLAFITFFAVPL